MSAMVSRFGSDSCHCLGCSSVLTVEWTMIPSRFSSLVVVHSRIPAHSVLVGPSMYMYSNPIHCILRLHCIYLCSLNLISRERPFSHTYTIAVLARDLVDHSYLFLPWSSPLPSSGNVSGYLVIWRSPWCQGETNAFNLITYSSDVREEQNFLLTLWCRILLRSWDVWVSSTVNSRYSGPLNCSHRNIAATSSGTDWKLH